MSHYPSSSPITVPVINLSDACSLDSRRRLGNTGQKRKSSLLQNNMIDVARHAGEAMVEQLKEMREMSKTIEKEKLEVQLRPFSERMSFLCNKDTRLNENVKAAQKNARLAIEKQGELIHCLANIFLY
jgi:hypothetical protein